MKLAICLYRYLHCKRAEDKLSGRMVACLIDGEVIRDLSYVIYEYLVATPSANGEGKLHDETKCRTWFRTVV